MSKRKRVSKASATPPSSPPGDESNDDAAPKDDMVHVTSDLLAGSPDIFSSKRAEGEASPAVEPEASEPNETAAVVAKPASSEQVTEPEPEPEPPAESEAHQASTKLASEPPASPRLEPQ